MAGVYQGMLEVIRLRRAAYAVLLDPDRSSAGELGEEARIASEHADFIFVGGSICVRHDFDQAVGAIKQNWKCRW